MPEPLCTGRGPFICLGTPPSLDENDLPTMLAAWFCTALFTRLVELIAFCTMLSTVWLLALDLAASCSICFCFSLVAFLASTIFFFPFIINSASRWASNASLTASAFLTALIWLFTLTWSDTCFSHGILGGAVTLSCLPTSMISFTGARGPFCLLAWSLVTGLSRETLSLDLNMSRIETLLPFGFLRATSSS